MDVDALRRMVDGLRALDVPSDKFDLLEWECGTSACAIGWAIKRGFAPVDLKLAIQYRGDGDLIYPYWGNPAGIDAGLTPTGFAAVARAFDISVDDAWFLFSHETYMDRAGPLDVAARIDRYLNGEKS